MRLKPLPILFHLTPIIPLGMGWTYITVAALILVAVPYIKVRKLSAQLADLLDRHPDGAASARLDERQRLVLEKEKASLEKTIRLWASLTLF